MRRGKVGSDVRRKVRSREGTATPRSGHAESRRDDAALHASAAQRKQLQSELDAVRNGHGALCSSLQVRAFGAVAADAGARRLRFGVSVAWQYGLHAEQHRAQEGREGN